MIALLGVLFRWFCKDESLSFHGNISRKLAPVVFAVGCVGCVVIGESGLCRAVPASGRRLLNMSEAKLLAGKSIVAANDRSGRDVDKL